MPIDAYSLCPGGTGKKIKFCCPDFVGELEKIIRMLEGEQQLGCLKHIDQLQEKTPDRACLFALKSMLLRGTGQIEGAEANAATFIEKHPENPTAMAESAIVTAAKEGGLAAIKLLHRAMAGCKGDVQSSVFDAMTVVARALLVDGEWLAARAVLRLLTAISREDRQSLEMLIELNRSVQVPLILKDDAPLANCPEEATWKTRFEEALAPIALAGWQEAADKLAALAEDVPDEPIIWRNLAMLCGWLADKPGQIEALRKFASLDVPFEDAVEAEVMAILATEDPLGDRIEMLNVQVSINDLEKVETGLTLDGRAQQMPFDPAAMTSDDSPPPKAAYLLLDRPIVEKAEEVTLQTVSQFVGQAMLYGRQTDREARLEVIGVVAGDLEKLKTILAEITGGALDAEIEQEVMGQVAASQELMQQKWRPPNDVTREQMGKLGVDHQRDALLKQWPEMKLGLFDGKSPREVAADPDARTKLLAAVMVLEFWNDRAPGDFDFNELRSELGLPTLDPIDAAEITIETIPLIRLARVRVDTMTDDALLLGYRRSVAYGAAAAMEKFARAVIERPSLDGDEGQLRAYGQLAQMEEDPDEALKYIEGGRKASLAAKISCASWDLLELPVRLVQGNSQEASNLVNHLQSSHMQEPGVAEALMQLLVRFGIIRPDGTPAGPMPGGPAPAGVEPMAAEPEQGKIWTPGSDEPGGEKKLWTPD